MVSLVATLQKKATKALAIMAIVASAAASSPAQAASSVGVKVVCPITGPGIVTCGTVGTLLHEALQCANGKKCFGKNGEIAKGLEGARREGEKIVEDRLGLKRLDRETRKVRKRLLGF